MEYQKKNIGKNLSHLMEKYELTESDIAKRLSVSQSTVNHWKRGLSCPSGNRLVNLASMFCITPAMLLKDNCSASDCILFDDEEQLLHEYRTLTQDAKQALVTIARILSDKCWIEKNKKVVNI